MGWLDKLFASTSSPPSDAPAEVSRRDLLTGGFLRALKAAPTPLARVSAGFDRLEQLSDLDDEAQADGPDRSFPLLRPPGAVEESAFLANCTRCSLCEQACPHQAIIMAPERMRQAAGTPIIDPAAHPCLMCPDTPCITACPTAVLHRQPDSPYPVMGTARITNLDCLAWQGSICTTCHERCPAPGAITLDSLCRPSIQPDICTGCGVCQHVCPAPHNAIIIMPESERQPLPYQC